MPKESAKFQVLFNTFIDNYSNSGLYHLLMIKSKDDYIRKYIYISSDNVI